MAPSAKDIAMDQPAGNRILIFLPKAAATLIAARLNEIDYATSIACSTPELREALASATYRLVVTTRLDIDTVREIAPLPVINLEVFFHPDPYGVSPGIRTKQFDTKAFLRRVIALTELNNTTERPAAVSAGKGRWRLRRLLSSPRRSR
jgi:hypothetical protein